MRKDGESSIFRSDEEAGVSMPCILCVWDEDKSPAVISSLNFSGRPYGRETENAEAWVSFGSSLYARFVILTKG
jgi:hypothetical protein